MVLYGCEDNGHETAHAMKLPTNSKNFGRVVQISSNLWFSTTHTPIPSPMWVKFSVEESAVNLDTSVCPAGNSAGNNASTVMSVWSKKETEACLLLLILDNKITTHQACARYMPI